MRLKQIAAKSVSTVWSERLEGGSNEKHYAAQAREGITHPGWCMREVENLAATSDSCPMLVETSLHQESDIKTLLCRRLLHPAVGRRFTERGGQHMHHMIRRLLRRAGQSAEESRHRPVAMTGSKLRIARPTCFVLEAELELASGFAQHNMM